MVLDADIEAFLNTLGEAERAGGRVLHELYDLANSFKLKELLKKTAHDEGYWAGELAAHVRRLGGRPSNRTGDFVDKVRATDGLENKLVLLNRGQRWVIRKIEEKLPQVDDSHLRAFLEVMAKSHHDNIAAVEEALTLGLK